MNYCSKLETISRHLIVPYLYVWMVKAAITKKVIGEVTLTKKLHIGKNKKGINQPFMLIRYQ